MTIHRQHDDLTVEMFENSTILSQTRSGRRTADQIRLTKAQLYALVDDVAVADPDEWERRFPQNEGAELALRRLATYFRERSRVNRQAAGRSSGTTGMYWNTMADTFDLAVTRVMEEIEELYPAQEPHCNWCPTGVPLTQYHPDGSVAHIGGTPPSNGQEAVNQAINKEDR